MAELLIHNPSQMTRRGVGLNQMIWFFILLVSLIPTSARSQQMFHHLLTMNNWPAFTWTGAGGDTNWNTAANWSTGAVPSLGDTARFVGAACGTNCNVTINVNISVKGFDIQSDYTGTITQGAGVTITVGSDGWTQVNGTFVGGTSDLVMNGPFALSGGAFTATAGSWTVNRDFTLSGSPTFNTNSGTLIFNGSVSQAIDPGSFNYNNVIFTTASAVTHTLAVGSTMNVLGTLTLACTNVASSALNGGTINAKGNVSASSYGFYGSTLVKVAGNSNQTVNGFSTAQVPTFEIASTGGTVTLSGYLVFSSTYTYTSGTVSTTGSTVFFDATSSVTVTPGSSINYNNVVFDGYNITYTLSGTLNVLGDLTINGTSNSPYANLDGGTVSVSGNVIVTNYGMLGTSLIKIAGNTNQSITGDANSTLPSLQIASTGGTVSFAGTFNVTRTYTHTSGTVNAGTSHVIFGTAVSSTITPGSTAFYDVSLQGYGTTLTLSGTLTVNGTLTLAGSSTSPYATLTGGSLVANGDVVFANFGFIGTTPLTLGGSTSTNLTVGASAARLQGTIAINKTSSATVSLQSNVAFTGTGQDLTITAGNFDLNGYTLNVTDVLTISVSGALICSGGSYTRGSLVNNGTIDCPGYPFNWTGAGGNTNWNTAANWAGGVAPGASDIVVFKDAYCGSTCNATMNVAVSVKGVRLLSGYSGTITQAAGITVTVGTSGWSQAGGTFTGNNANVTINGAYTLSGGTFNAPAANMYFNGNVTSSGSPTFNAGSSTALFNTGATITPGSLVFNNSTIGNSSSCYNVTWTVVGNLSTQNLSLTCGDFYSGVVNGGTVSVAGNLTSSASTNIKGTVAIIMTGTGTITGGASSSMPALQINTTGSYSLSGTLSIRGSYTVTAGTVNPGTASLTFSGTGTITPGNFNYNNVTLGASAQETACYSMTQTISGTFKVQNLTYNCSDAMAGYLNGGSIEVSGNVTLNNGGRLRGTTEVYMVGTGTFSGGTNAEISNLTINTSGTITISGTPRINGNYTLTAGTINAGTSTLIFSNSKTITPGNADYYNVQIGSVGSESSCWNLTQTIVGTLKVQNLTATCVDNLTATINTGTIDVKGDLTIAANTYMRGTATIVMSGTGTITGASTSYIPALTINTTGTTTFSGSVNVYGNYTYTAGTVSAGTSTLGLYNSKTVTPGNINYYNVTIGSIGPNAACYNQNQTISGTLKVQNLTISCPDTLAIAVNTGTIDVAGDITSLASSKMHGTAALVMTGATAATITQNTTSNWFPPSFTINKPGATVTLAKALGLANTGADLTITAGTLDLAGFTLNVVDVLTIGASGTLKCSGGSYTRGTLVNSGTITCP